MSISEVNAQLTTPVSPGRIAKTYGAVVEIVAVYTLPISSVSAVWPRISEVRTMDHAAANNAIASTHLTAGDPHDKLLRPAE